MTDAEMTDVLDNHPDGNTRVGTQSKEHRTNHYEIRNTPERPITPPPLERQ